VKPRGRSTNWNGSSSGLNQAEVCVVRNDADAAGHLAEQAGEKIAAACWILGSRLRAREPGPPGRDDARRGERLPGQATP